MREMEKYTSEERPRNVWARERERRRCGLIRKRGRCCETEKKMDRERTSGITGEKVESREIVRNEKG